jgi:hypothetical protein
MLSIKSRGLVDLRVQSKRCFNRLGNTGIIQNLIHQKKLQKSIKCSARIQAKHQAAQCQQERFGYWPSWLAEQKILQIRTLTNKLHPIPEKSFLSD